MKLQMNLRSSGRHQMTTLRQRAPELVAHALNRSATSAVAVMARPVAADMRLKVAVVKSSVRVVPATQARPFVQVFAGAKRIPLIEFGATGPFPSRGRGKGVRARTSKRFYPGAFIAVVGKGRHKGVFMRQGKSRSRAGMKASSPGLPIKQLFMASIAHVFPKHVAAGMARFREQFPKNLRSNFRYFLTRS